MRRSSSALPITQPLTLPRRASETTSLIVETPPEAISFTFVSAPQLPVERERRPAQHAVARDVGDERLVDAERFDVREDVCERGSRLRVPSRPCGSRRRGRRRPGRCVSAPNVSTSAASSRGESAATVPTTMRSAPQSIQRRASSTRSDAAADLHDEIAQGQPPDQVRLDRTSAARRLEIDDVQPRAARDVERVEHRFRLAVGARRGEVAAREPHHASAEEVERGDHFACDEVPQHAQSGGGRFLGMKLHAEHALRAAPRR